MNDEFINGLADIASNTIEQIIMLADKNGIDRDEAVQKFNNAFLMACLTGTFKNFKVGGNENE
ncbi:MAG: hypothetical protein PUG88_01475 [Eubacterium coprostanoligenes]|uniref:hypothetical protein n=1 Tax=Eubacterium coprostanoligenes TaxID=290054 RepID=UPI0023F57C81|nr:hypothetical protein [Eubacterium coprostanoligenes]MDD7357516.1 hypothetical protein [Eubacterium coprostanoligenes]